MMTRSSDPDALHRIIHDLRDCALHRGLPEAARLYEAMLGILTKQAAENAAATARSAGTPTDQRPGDEGTPFYYTLD